MGNAVGKKKKFGTAKSAKWVVPDVKSRRGGSGPIARTNSLPAVHQSNPKSDNYHTVALTSSTYGILKDDPTKALEEIPDFFVPKPQSDVVMPSFTQSIKHGEQGKDGAESALAFHEEPEIINTWELMEGLDDDCNRSPSPWEMSPNPYSPQSNVWHKKAESLDSALAFSSVDTLSKNDVEILEGMVKSELKSAIESDTLIVGKCYTSKSPSRASASSTSFSSVRTASEGDLEYLEGVVKSELKSAVDSDTLIKGKCYSPPSSSHFPATSTSVSQADVDFLEDLVKSELKSAVDSNTLVKGKCYTRKSPSHASHQSLRQLSEKENDSSLATSFSLNSSGLTGHSPSSNFKSSYKSDTPLKVSRKGAGVGKGMITENNGSPTRLGDEVYDSEGFLSVIPKFSDLSLKADSKSGPSPPSKSAVSSNGLLGGKSSASLQSEQNQSPQARLESKDVSALGFSSEVLSGLYNPEDEASEASPLFDPELLASFDVPDDEWYRIRNNDAEVASTSRWSMDSGRSPLTVESQNSNSSTPVGASSLVRNSDFDSNSRKTGLSKVAPEDFRKVVLQKVRKVDPFEKFEKRCPPRGEDRVVLYLTSLRGIRKTFEECSHMKLVLLGYRVAIDVRDVSMHADFRQELKELLGMPKPVPRLFIKGCYIGGAEEVSLFHEDGTLAKLLESMPIQTSWEQCDGCGDHRFVPCPSCSGSRKIVTDDDDIVVCTECNENGLVKCSVCL